MTSDKAHVAKAVHPTPANTKRRCHSVSAQSHGVEVSMQAVVITALRHWAFRNERIPTARYCLCMMACTG